MPDQTMRDQAQGIGLANAAVFAHLLRAFVSRGILTKERALALLGDAATDLVAMNTMPGAIGAGHVAHIRDVFEKPPRSRRKS